MKKLALLLKWVIIMFSLRLFYLVCRQIWYVILSFKNETIERPVFFGIKIPEDLSQTWYVIVSVLSCILLFYVLYLLNVFRLVAQGLLENQIFTHKTSKQLTQIGKGLLIFGVILVLAQITLSTTSFFAGLTDRSVPYSLGYVIGYIIGFVFKFLLSTGLPIFMAALFVFIIANLTKEGHILKKENDLTI